MISVIVTNNCEGFDSQTAIFNMFYAMTTMAFETSLTFPNLKATILKFLDISRFSIIVGTLHWKYQCKNTVEISCVLFDPRWLTDRLTDFYPLCSNVKPDSWRCTAGSHIELYFKWLQLNTSWWVISSLNWLHNSVHNLRRSSIVVF